jgi:hypothetical protein
LHPVNVVGMMTEGLTYERAARRLAAVRSAGGDIDRCPYYHMSMTVLVREAIVFCDHKHSPAPRCGETLPEVEPHLLACDGNLDKCQIPVESQLDIH